MVKDFGSIFTNRRVQVDMMEKRLERAKRERSKRVSEWGVSESEWMSARSLGNLKFEHKFRPAPNNLSTSFPPRHRISFEWCVPFPQTRMKTLLATTPTPWLLHQLRPVHACVSWLLHRLHSAYACVRMPVCVCVYERSISGRKWSRYRFWYYFVGVISSVVWIAKIINIIWSTIFT